MKTLRIRKWMVIGMISIVIFPWWAFLIVHMWNQGEAGNWPGQISQTQKKAMENAQTIIVQGYSNWNSATYQAELSKKLDSMGVEANILDSSGNIIFGNHHTKPWMNQWMHPSTQTAVLENGHEVGTVKLFVQTPFDGIAFISAICAMVFAIILVSLQLRRNVIRPLEAMSEAARKIACGDLDFRLPITRVREIAQVRTAFHVMRDGLQASVEQQAKLEEERRFFVGAIAHDLRTPLFALRGYLEGLIQGVANSPEKAEKYLAMCREKSDQLDRLVSDLFAFTKLEYMEQSLQREEMNFAQAITRSVDSLLQKAQENHVQIICEGMDKSYTVIGDTHLLERAMSNLLDNALRYTPSGGQITVECRMDNAKIRFSIKDTGTGFAVEDLPHVFNPLYRGETSRNRETGGTGLGLTIARRILRAHGGDLTAANQKSGGAELSGWIPIAPNHSTVNHSI